MDVEDGLFNEISIVNFLSRNDFDNMQVSKEDMNEFLTTVRDPYIAVNLSDELQKKLMMELFFQLMLVKWQHK